MSKGGSKYEDKSPCGYATKCTSCPLPHCIYNGHNKPEIESRDRRILVLHNAGKTVTYIANVFDIPERTVKRVLKKK